MSNIYKNYIVTCDEIKRLNAVKDEFLVKIWEENQAEFNTKETGTIDVKRDGFNIRFVKKVTTKISDVDGLKENFPSLCNIKESVGLIAKEYNSLTEADKKIADNYLETKDAKPVVTVGMEE